MNVPVYAIILDRSNRSHVEYWTGEIKKANGNKFAIVTELFSLAKKFPSEKVAEISADCLARKCSSIQGIFRVIEVLNHTPEKNYLSEYSEEDLDLP